MLGQLVCLPCIMDYGDAVCGPIYDPQLVLPGRTGVELQISWNIKIIGDRCNFSLTKMPIRNIPTSRILVIPFRVVLSDMIYRVIAPLLCLPIDSDQNLR